MFPPDMKKTTYFYMLKHCNGLKHTSISMFSNTISTDNDGDVISMDMIRLTMMIFETIDVFLDGVMSLPDMTQIFTKQIKRTMVKTNNIKTEKVVKSTNSRVRQDIIEGGADMPVILDNVHSDEDEDIPGVVQFSSPPTIMTESSALATATSQPDDLGRSVFSPFIHRAFTITKLHPVVDRKYVDTAGISVYKCVLNVEICFATGIKSVITVWGANANNVYEYLE